MIVVMVARALLLAALGFSLAVGLVLAADEPAPSSPAPAGIAVDPSDGSVYVSDYALDRVLKFGSDGTLLAQWGGSGSALGQFSAPFGVAVGEGSVYVVDQLNGRIQKFATDGTPVGAFGSVGGGNDQLRTPFGITLAGGRIYVADFGNDRVQVFSTDGSWTAMLGSRGVSDGQFQRPAGVAVDRDGNLFVTDHFNDRVQRFGGDGRFASVLGSSVAPAVAGAAGSSGSATGASASAPAAVAPSAASSSSSAPLIGTPAPTAVPDTLLRRPEGIALDRDGNLWVADYGRDRLVKLSPDGRLLQSIGSHGSGSGEFQGPKGVAVDPGSGRIYVADTGNARVERLLPDGTPDVSWPLPAPAAPPQPAAPTPSPAGVLGGPAIGAP